MTNMFNKIKVRPAKCSWCFCNICLEVGSLDVSVFMRSKSYAQNSGYFVGVYTMFNSPQLVIVGEGVLTPPPFVDQSPFSKIPPFLEIQDVPTFYRSIRKTTVLKDCFNRFLHNFYS